MLRNLRIEKQNLQVFLQELCDGHGPTEENETGHSLWLSCLACVVASPLVRKDTELEQTALLLVLWHVPLQSSALAWLRHHGNKSSLKNLSVAYDMTAVGIKAHSPGV